MLKGMAILFCFQLTGEVIAVGSGLPVSGPIIGMALLLGWMQMNGRIDDRVASAADGLLANMPVLFVPVGVGAIAYIDLFQRHWLFVLTAVVIGVLVTIATTAMTARFLARKRSAGVPAQT